MGTHVSEISEDPDLGRSHGIPKAVLKTVNKPGRLVTQAGVISAHHNGASFSLLVVLRPEIVGICSSDGHCENRKDQKC